jgi:alginate O-acetyltransferase complex protein AlgI
MSAYLPSSLHTLAILLSSITAVVLAGHALARTSPGVARPLAWALLVLGTLGVERLLDREPAGVRMLGLITFALVVMKVIVVVEERARNMPALTFGAWVGFAAGCFGMDPRIFATATRVRQPGAGALIRRGLRNALLGAVLVVSAKLGWEAMHSRLLATLLLLPGLSLLLHFGLCNLCAGAWRVRGVPCEALFRAPARSENLAEFWGRRWNLAFSEMVSKAVYRPLAKRVGRSPALMACFALSGLLHEMAISVPVRAGFGLPSLYFVAHGGLVLLERALMSHGRPLTGRVGRVWTAFWVLAPLPLLFHRPFLAGVVWPLLGIPSSD